MKRIDLKKSEYRHFIEDLLKQSDYIIISVLEKDDMIGLFGESGSLPERIDYRNKRIDYRNINFAEYEQLYCYEIKYHEALSELLRYESLKEFFDITNVYRLIFVANGKVSVECMYDEIIVY